MISLPFLVLFKLMYLSGLTNQTGTLYFDESWRPVSKQSMMYYMPLPEKIGDNYLFKDYYKSGKLYFEALSASKTEMKFNGLAKFYAESGQLIEVTTLDSGRVNGQAHSFDEKGRIKCDAVYLKGKQLHALMFDYQGDVEGSKDYDTALKIENEQMTVEIIFDGDIKGIRQETYFIDKVVKSYDSNGKLIGTAVLDMVNDPVEGTVVDYLYHPMRVDKITQLKKEK